MLSAIALAITSIDRFDIPPASLSVSTTLPHISLGHMSCATTVTVWKFLRACYMSQIFYKLMLYLISAYVNYLSLFWKFWNKEQILEQSQAFWRFLKHRQFPHKILFLSSRPSSAGITLMSVYPALTAVLNAILQATNSTAHSFTENPTPLDSTACYRFWLCLRPLFTSIPGCIKGKSYK